MSTNDKESSPSQPKNISYAEASHIKNSKFNKQARALTPHSMINVFSSTGPGIETSVMVQKSITN